MLDMSKMNAETAAKILAAAAAEATRRCDVVLAACERLSATAAQRARAKRDVLAEFTAADRQGPRAKMERAVLDLFRNADGDVTVFATRDDLLAAVDLYCAAGKAEAERRFG